MLLVTQAMMLLIEYFHRNLEYGTTSFAHLSRDEQKSTNMTYGKLMLRNLLLAFTARCCKSLFDFYKKNTSSVKVHDSMLSRMMNAPVNLFFDTHRQDKIQERFTSDLRSFEDNYVGDFMHILYHHFTMLILVYQVQWQVILFWPMILIGMFWLFNYAWTAHRKLERLQRKIWRDKSQAKMETLNGNSTIKAFGK